MNPQHLHEVATHIRDAHQHQHLSALAALEPYIDKLLDRITTRGDH